MNKVRPACLSVRFLPIICTLLLFQACSNENTTNDGSGKLEVEPTLTAAKPLLALLTPAQTGVDFQNLIIEDEDDNFTTNFYKYTGGGVAVADINNDGLQDIYFINTNGKEALYLNEGGMKFKNIAETAGVSSEEGVETAVTAVDINSDGWMDFYVCRAGVKNNDARRNRLYVNNGNLTFTERAKEFGIDDISPSTGANFFDSDNDGDLDLYLLTYPTSTIIPNITESTIAADGKTRIPNVKPHGPLDTHRFYRNDNGKYVDISKEAGVQTYHWGLSLLVSDFNHDGWQDVFVGVDFVQPDILFINNKNGTFTNHLDDYFQHTSRNTMGSDLVDFDNDGQLDLLATDMLPTDNKHRKTSASTPELGIYISTVQNGYPEQVARNVLQRNNGNGTFSDIGCLAGIYKTHWSWSSLLFDMDNDGFRDMFITNGYMREINNRDFFNFQATEIQNKYKGVWTKEASKDLYKIADQLPSLKSRNFCYQNKGDWTFPDKGGDWMTIPASWSCGAVWADLDNDGDLDMVINNINDPAFIYQNLARDQNKGNYLQVKVQGSALNPQATGASAAIYYGDKVQYLELNPVRGIFSSVENLLHFGLGQTQTVDKMVVRWSDGKTQILTDVAANQRLTLKYADASGYTAYIGPEPPKPQYFEEKNVGLDWAHEENDFNDFTNWLLNPWSETDLGPIIAVGDVNGDGLDDFFVGGAFDKPAALFVQKPNGQFQRTNKQLFETEKVYEDHGAIFLDANADGKLDLLVVSGGMETDKSLAWQNRLYINEDGKGNFVKSPNQMPQSKDIGFRVASYDYDGDGDLDLFIGGRVRQGKWPLTPHSLVFQNNIGSFSDVTAEVAPDFDLCGMVTDLVWSNIDADPEPELIVVGEWMPVSIFKLVNKKLVNVTAQFGLEKSNGLWFRAAVADLDGDGDNDIVTGNLGLNTRLVASAEFPLRCYAKDFDKNGQIDPLMAYAEDGKVYPMVQKEVLYKQIPQLKKKFIYGEVYGEATIDMVYPQKELDEGLSLVANTLETCWWENQGGKFVQRKLPNPAQTSPVQGILVDDFTGDGFVDILMAGNKYGLEIETNRSDASNGVLLRGDGKGNFTFVQNTASGFWASKEVRDLALLRGPGGKTKVLVTNNNAAPQVFSRK
ncbi:MAG: VCBS repeat-containing protein [Saprospiraceae bacterium]|nr:VCBS repeat-containing protein [Saprospiraceae bacterium]MCF8252494.1 VCBS repeat-containing protein [Saprospiraceae bacterium]MCF8282518.1 VCBS repeat-containing protein [Bacteroidales bacterium]MCF8314117.1 VCBS repeat-containing protein [Saprospiraceae bacterium]MCF8442848.1 VCBS repeat-containing protein [Saprospiraceae bacterium]